MATDSISQQKSEQHEHGECPRCVALAESNTELLAALHTIGVWLIAPDLKPATLTEMRGLVSAAIAKAQKGA